MFNVVDVTIEKNGEFHQREIYSRFEMIYSGVVL